MVLLKKKEISKDKISYYYQIEGKGRWGTLAYFPATGKLRVEDFAQDEDEVDNYRNHAFSAMLKFYRTNDYPDEKLVAWY